MRVAVAPEPGDAEDERERARAQSEPAVLEGERVFARRRGGVRGARDGRVEVELGVEKARGPARRGGGAIESDRSGCAWEKTGGRASAAAVIGGRKKHQDLRAARGSSAP